MSLTLKIPVGNAPDWEKNVSNDENVLNSIPESSAVHHSLRQSRNAWLTSVFPKFASKLKAKGQKDVLQPPHNLRFIAKCDIEIGPHIFPDTSVYEAHYFPEPSQYTTGIPWTYPQTTGYPRTANGSYSYPLTSYNTYVEPSGSNASISVTAPNSTMPSTDPSLNVTPALIAQVNDAAASNPTLHNLLQTAASGEASMDQLKTLGFFIQSLAASQQQAPSQTPSTKFLGTPSVTPPTAFAQASQYSPPHAALAKPDLVLEFRENHNERFLVPREIMACEQEIPASDTFRKDIVLYTFVPFLNDENKFKPAETVSTSSRTPTVIRLLGVSEALWDSIRGWVNEEAKRTDAWDTFYDKTEASARRAYLQYRLPSGDLLSQLRIACNNGYTMKSIKPSTVSEVTSGKRSRSRRTHSQTAKNTKTPADADSIDTQAAPATGMEGSASVKEPGHKRRKTTSKSTSKPVTAAANGLYFINTMAPPPLQLHAETPQIPLSQGPTSYPLPQPSNSIS